MSKTDETLTASNPTPSAADLQDERLISEQGLSGWLAATWGRIRTGDLGSLPVVIGLVGSALGVLGAIGAGLLVNRFSGTLLADLPGLTLVAFDPVTVATVERGLRLVVFCSIEIAGLRPSIWSTSGFCIRCRPMSSSLTMSPTRP